MNMYFHHEEEFKRNKKIIMSDESDEAHDKIAISWLIQKIEKLDKPIKDKEIFFADIKTQIKNSRASLGCSALLCTCESLFDKKNGINSLKDILKKHNVDIKGYMMSISITSEGVFVADGFGAGKKKINYDDVFVV